MTCFNSVAEADWDSAPPLLEGATSLALRRLNATSSTGSVTGSHREVFTFLGEIGEQSRPVIASKALEYRNGSA